MYCLISASVLAIIAHLGQILSERGKTVLKMCLLNSARARKDHESYFVSDQIIPVAQFGSNFYLTSTSNLFPAFCWIFVGLPPAGDYNFCYVYWNKEYK
jgi:hypothetical protein